MKTLLSIIAAAIVFVISLCGCSDGKPTLYVYTWADYIDPSLVSQFEASNGCHVVIDTFDSNETAYAKLKAGATGYDIVMPTSYIIPLLIKEGLITRLDHGKLPNVRKNYDSRYSGVILDTNMTYSVPYAFSVTGLMYRKDVLPDGFEFKSDWGMLTNSVFGGRVCILDDYREILGCALRTLGFSVNSTNGVELAKATDLAKEWKRHVKKMDNEAYRNGIASSEFHVAMGYNSDAVQTMLEDSGIGFVIPDATDCCFDELCILQSGCHHDLAHAFIDFIYRKDNAISNMLYICGPMPIAGADELVPTNVLFRELIVPSDELLGKCELIRDIGDGNILFNKAWDSIKSSRE